MNHMKTGLVIFLMITITGCEGFLDEDLKSELSPNNTLTSTYGFEVASTGLYAIARAEYNILGEKWMLSCMGALVHTKHCKFPQTL